MEQESGQRRRNTDAPDADEVVKRGFFAVRSGTQNAADVDILQESQGQGQRHNDQELSRQRRYITALVKNTGDRDVYKRQEWGDPSHYDLVIDAGRLGTDAAAYLIAAYVQQFDPKT